MTERQQLWAGLGLTLLGVIVAIVGGFLVHTAEAPEVNDLGQSIYVGFPRGWLPALVAQMISLGGVLMSMGGILLAFVYGRTLTWARAMIGGMLFTGLMFIIFAIIPNQMLTLFQGTLDWNATRTLLTVPPAMVLGNEVAISYAAAKDMIVAGYVTTALIVVPVAMYQYQERTKKKKDQPKPEPVSSYGRPMRAGG